MTDPSDPTPCRRCGEPRESWRHDRRNDNSHIYRPEVDDEAIPAEIDEPVPPEPEKKTMKQELPADWRCIYDDGHHWSTRTAILDDLLALIPRLDPEQRREIARASVSYGPDEKSDYEVGFEEGAKAREQERDAAIKERDAAFQRFGEFQGIVDRIMRDFGIESDEDAYEVAHRLEAAATRLANEREQLSALAGALTGQRDAAIKRAEDVAKRQREACAVYFGAHLGHCEIREAPLVTDVDRAIAPLVKSLVTAPAPEPPKCGTCGGSGIRSIDGAIAPNLDPRCPDCSDGEGGK